MSAQGHEMSYIMHGLRGGLRGFGLAGLPEDAADSLRKVTVAMDAYGAAVIADFIFKGRPRDWFAKYSPLITGLVNSATVKRTDGRLGFQANPGAVSGLVTMVKEMVAEAPEVGLIAEANVAKLSSALVAQAEAALVAVANANKSTGAPAPPPPPPASSLPRAPAPPPPAPGAPGAGAAGAGEEDNTLLYVGVAALVVVGVLVATGD